ncbi:MAG TPA: SBBP repeat-containing protein [Bryobacteraceae bacterium]|nr:SBBP repeat-containing protein [Bryobacteraceae bacterium]
MRLGDRTLRTAFVGANPAAPFTGVDQSAHPTNWFRGKAYQRVENFSKLRRTGVYPGIDLIYYSRNGELEYDFEVAPGADPSRIAMRFEGADSLRLNEHGDLVVSLAGEELTQRAPEIYQRKASGEMVAVSGSYRVAENGIVRFQLGGYDRSAALVIDPAVAYVAFLSGSASDQGISVGHDPQGYIYFGGYTYSTDFPSGGIGYSKTSYGSLDCFLMKINPYASDPTQVIVYSSYFGGTSDDILTAMQVDAAGIMYFTGSTDSTDFPVSGGAYASLPAAPYTHAFLVALDSNQDSIYSEIYSTYFGGTTGNEVGEGIYQANGFIYITGFSNSTDLPTSGAFQGTLAGSDDAFVAKFDPTQQGQASLIFCSYLGGGAQDRGLDVAVDSKGLIYVTGFTYSLDIGYTTNGYSNYAGGGDAFLAVIDPSQSALNYLTFFGGSSGYDSAKRMVVDPNGKWVAIAGYTMSSDLPHTQNAYQPVMPSLTNVDSSGNQLATNGFLAVFDMTKATAPGQGLLYATYFGGYAGEVIYGVNRDSQGRFYLCGYTLSSNLPVTNNAFNSASAGGGLNGFVTILDITAPNQLVYSSYVTGPGNQTVHGVDIDSHGTVWITGMASGNIFPAGYETFPTNPQTGAAQPGKQASYIWGFNLP